MSKKLNKIKSIDIASIQMMQDFYENNKVGLALLNKPTGQGKSHTTKIVITGMTLALLDKLNIDELKTQEEKDFYSLFKKLKGYAFFSTGLKINLFSKKDLVDIAKDIFNCELDENFVLILPSKEDLFFEEKSKSYSSFIPNEFKTRSPILKDKLKQIDERQSSIKKIKVNHSSDIEEAKKKFGEIESDIKEEIKLLLEKDKVYTGKKTLKEKALYIEQEYPWIAELYPAIKMYNTKITIFTNHKLLYPIDPLIEKNFSLQNNDLFINDKSILIIDEFDAFAKIALDVILDKENNSNINNMEILELVYKGRDKILDNTIPKGLLNEKLILDYKQIINKIEELKKEINFIGHSIEASNILIENYGSCYIYDNKIYNSTKSKTGEELNKYFKIIFNEDSNKYEIIVDEKNEFPNATKLVDFMNKINYIAYLWEYLINSIANLYMKNKNENIKSGELLGRKEAVLSILDELGFSCDNIGKILTEPILQIDANRTRKEEKEAISLAGKSFYEIGFYINQIIKRTSHNEKCKIYDYGLRNTPENILLQFALRTKVLGLSATAETNSVISNFNLKYIKQVLEDKFYELKDDLKEKMTNSTNQIYEDYEREDIKIHVIKIDDKDTLAETLGLVFKGFEDKDKIINDLFNFLESRLNKTRKDLNENEYELRRIAKMALVERKKFEEGINKFNGTMSFKNNDISKNEISNDFYIKCIEYLHNHYPDQKSLKVHYLCKGKRSVDEFKKEIDEVQKEFNPKTPTTIVTTYNSLGAGVNITAFLDKSSDISNIKPVNERGLDELNSIKSKKNSKVKCDINSIYLEKPTFVIPSIGQEREIKVYTKKEMRQLIYIIKGLSYNGEIDINALNENELITKIFSNDNIVNDVKNTDSYKNAIDKTLNQAVGRMCRTPIKNKNIYIFVDEAIFKSDFPNNTGLSYISPEVDALRTEWKKYQNKYKENAFNMTAAEINFICSAEKAKTIIERELKALDEYRKGNDSVFANNYKSLRGEHILLKRLLLQDDSEFEKLPAFAKPHYVKQKVKVVNGIFYYYDIDYDDDPKTGKLEVVKFNKNNDLREASVKDLHLDIFSKNPVIKEYFEKHDIKTDYEDGEYSYVISPYSYFNYVKGDLGEIITELIFDNPSILMGLMLSGWKLKKELKQSCFELSDYELFEDNEKIIVLDAKNQYKFYDSNNKFYSNIENKIKTIETEYGKRCVYLVFNIKPSDQECKVFEKNESIFVISSIINKNGEFNLSNDKFEQLVNKIK